MIVSTASLLAFATVIGQFGGVQAAALEPRACVGTITSISTVAAAKLCTTISISPFTVPDKTIFDLTGLLTGTVVNLLGNVNVCGKTPWADGPCFSISGTSITFNGGGYTFNGNGASFWDTLGSNGGVDKPKMFSVTMSGTFKDLHVANSPRHVFSIGNKAALTISNVNIDNTAGNTLSGGKTLGHNTDCFDVSASSVTISKCTCNNQDDCLAINSGSNIVFTGNKCIGGHGISIGSIATGKVVSTVSIIGNTVTDSTNGLRIKTVSGATGASVTGVSYTSNVVSGISDYGVVIQQDYLNGGPTGTPTNGVTIKDINFVSGNTVAVDSGAKEVYVLCGTGSCTGTWNWSGLKVSGGSKGSITPSSVPITGFTL
ncbi:glycoside hydrolase [Mrakia frigida]|uniref:glycoside hydrolase n=1 Tax=Mrakia frigida TaxID=29902 RepID=UPI003FCC058F